MINICGDNIYEPLPDGSFKQLRSMHCEGDIAKDLKGRNVLIGEQFYYFGKNAVELPESIHGIIKKGQGYKCNIPDYLIQEFLEFLSQYKPGINGNPTSWPETEGQEIESCRPPRKCR